MAFVVDASVLAAWLLPDEASPDTDALVDQLAGGSAYAPDLLVHEARNFMVMAVRRDRVRPHDLGTLLRRYEGLGIVTAGAGDSRAILDLSVRLDLTPYDAAYLALAIDQDLPLATLDKRLRRAAASEGIAVLPLRP